MKNTRRETYTYEEIAKAYKVTPNKIHSVVRTAYNKMVNHCVKQYNMNIFDAVMSIKIWLKMSDRESFEKLNKSNKLAIRKAAIDRYETKSGE